MIWVTVTSTSTQFTQFYPSNLYQTLNYIYFIYILTRIPASRLDASVFVVLLNKHMFYSAFLMVWVSTSNLIHLVLTTQIASNFVHILFQRGLTCVPSLRLDATVLAMLLNKQMFYSAFLVFWVTATSTSKNVYCNSALCSHPNYMKLCKHIVHVLNNLCCKFEDGWMCIEYCIE